jgi:hypothetical protein
MFGNFSNLVEEVLEYVHYANRYEKAAIFSVLVLLMALVAAVLIRFLDLTPNLAVWSCTSTVAALIMLLVVTRDGRRSRV